MAGQPPETSSTPEDLKRTPLHGRHAAAGAKLVPFAGYEMPVQYRGIVAEHQWTREKAGLFDVSHMGQALLLGPDHEAAAKALETLVPGDIASLKPGRMRYTLLLNEEGGVIDDLMVMRPADRDRDGTLLLVVNAARKDVDFAHLSSRLPAGVRLTPAPSLALLAVQGPASAGVLRALHPDIASLAFMEARELALDGVGQAIVTRSGYTGEDGFEISVPDDKVGELWDLLAADERVMPVGLGARDSLRLEAGLCLYGHELDETTSPIEADLDWTIPKRRREAGDFPGAPRILREIAEGPSRRRVGLKPEGRSIAREGAEIRRGEEVVGIVTSGGFGPSAGGAVAMGYVSRDALGADTLDLVVRGKAAPARIVPLPFVPHRYAR
ncbi:glycine cleavage system aminomethyltransferase GcvT [Lutibaculum baratangense]|uniref:aminomethyltransferase n=1 Tax=Lutibaculum baratangense AMV1 TaxID=631454 RepID=V4RSX1_9HYPH|nr:glycine cleavage system aminomethyltransferase GcvT [Lutibaculum baratangense]ESR26230.1 Aminomethyltransferase (glycine cleavage system T protein) [Lutibaculum baratangense AMV1]